MSVASYITQNEGYRQYMYKDTEGIWTIGIGFNLEEGFTLYECQLILEHRIQKLIGQLQLRVPAFRGLNYARQVVLIDMAYNLGMEGLLKFKKMLNAIEKNDWEEAAEELLDSKYATQVGRRATRNAQILRTGSLSENQT